MRYRLSEIAKIAGGRLYGADREVSGVVCDSRSFVGDEGAIFVAIEGRNHDSHTFISQMVARGIESFMVEREEACDSNEVSYLLVDNSIAALQRLAAHHRSLFGGVVVGITGSNGKTIVKEWLAQVAPRSVKMFRSPRSYNSQLGVALSLLMISGDEDVALIEAGISQCGEMQRLCEMIRPDVAVITSIGEAHQEGFESIAQKIEEKLRLAEGAREIVYHSGNRELIPHIIFRDKKVVDAAGFEAAQFSDYASRHNSQIVAAVNHLLGYDSPRFDKIKSVAMRMEMIDGVGGSQIINDSYNSDINSLSIALDALRTTAGDGGKVVIMSDILQSGVESAELYRRVGEAIKRAGVNWLIGVGSEISKWGDCFDCSTEFYPSTDDLLRHITLSKLSNHTILLKGNRESQFERVAHALAYKSHTTTLEIDLNAMRDNLNYYRSKLHSSVKLTAMVKASSYGAGDVEVAQVLQHEGVDYLAVAFADEGALLRERGITMPIIVLNADDGSFSQMVDSRLEPEIYSQRSLDAFAAAIVSRGERDYPIHVKLDTGMHRLGFVASDIEGLIKRIGELKGVVRINSIFSHLSSADMGKEGESVTLKQIAEFEDMSRELMESIDYPIMRHLANSAAIVAYAQAQFDMCRLGIGLYGFGEEEAQLSPVSTLKTRIVQIRQIKPQQHVGYGGAGCVTRASRIATIPIGYADGMNRHLGNGAWSVIIGGEAAPIVGRICMDSLMVDVSNIAEVCEGDEVVIFSAKEGNRASDMAQKLGTITYEVLTSISTRVKRVYIKD
ncbi:MAG: alanine racemase [Rikenellaceae bacterium]